MKTRYDFSQAQRGAVIQATGKTRITIHLDDEVLEAFRMKAATQGKGYQTLINDALRQAIKPEAAALTVEILRDVLHEELSGRLTTMIKKNKKAHNIASTWKSSLAPVDLPIQTLDNASNSIVEEYAY